MSKKNLISALIIFTIITLFSPCCKAISNIPNPEINIDVLAKEEGFTEIQEDRIKKVTFRERLKKSPETQINDFYKKYNKYSTKNNIDKLKELYSDTYINNDGFGKDIIFKLMEDALDTYKNVKYTTLINKVSVNGNYAVVEVKETATGETTKQIEKFKDNGFIKSEIKYIDYLKKEGTDWKITNTYVLSENIELTYGEAKNLTMDIQAPDCVSAGSEYDVYVNADGKTADGVFLIGSIVNEEIVYPQIQHKDKYHAVKSDSIARILKANTNGHNEYATTTIAVTRAQVEPSSVIINMTGMAFVMKRINVLAQNPNSKTE